MPRNSQNGCLNDFRLARAQVEAAKDTAIRLLSPENTSRMARRRNRLVYNLRAAGVPWWTICAIVRRCESPVRLYYRLGRIEADNRDNPFFFMPRRVRHWLAGAGVNIWDPCEYTKLLALGDKLDDYYPNIGKKSAEEIRQAAIEQAAYDADCRRDRAFARKLLERAREGWRLEGMAAEDGDL